jgi:hypothetical protein
MKSIHLGKIFGMQIDILPVTFLATLLLWIGLSAATYALRPPLGELILIGLVATLLHWTSVLLHHLGHFIASRRAGYPMSGLELGMFGILARDLYPADEPELLPAIHIRRALGGPIISGLLSVIFFLLLPLWSGNWYWLGWFILLENLFLFTLQVFVPLSFNDGGTILKNLRRKSS